MAKYRKKPVVIGAIQWVGTESSFNEILSEFKEIEVVSRDSNGRSFVIKTLEGQYIASCGDFIIKGVAGEFYPCKPDVFIATYESAE